MDKRAHWQNIYQTKNSKDVSWFASHLTQSLEFINKAGLKNNDPMIDVGAGASTLVDDLLEQGFTKLTALDISSESLEMTRRRLSHEARKIEWLTGDITEMELPKNYYKLWHDRAVFHFLTQREDKEKYKRALRESLKPKGYAVIAAFSLEGPEKCSGLEVVRYSPETLSKELGAKFKLLEASTDFHKTPFGTVQAFMYGLFQKF